MTIYIEHWETEARQHVNKRFLNLGAGVICGKCSIFFQIQNTYMVWLHGIDHVTNIYF